MLYKIKSAFRKKNKTLLTLSLILIVFVMSLGYAALSQFIELDGIAQIDRSWIIKITNITSSTTNTGVDVSKNFAGSTATMHSTLPAAGDTVVYTITLENQGNLKAKLSTINRIEDDNTSITYTISGVEEGVTTLNPGETNTAVVTIKYLDGVTNAASTEKGLMLTFDYVEAEAPESGEDSGSSGGSTEEETTFVKYYIGDKVTLLDGSTWYVVKTDKTTDAYVTLIKEQYIGSMPFDTQELTDYAPSKETNVGYYIDNVYIPELRDSLVANGGNPTGTTGRLVTSGEMKNLFKVTSFDQLGHFSPFFNLNTWMIGSCSNDSNSNASIWLDSTCTDDASSFFGEGTTNNSFPAIPVIITLKSNIQSVDLGYRIAFADNNIKGDYYSIDFGGTSNASGLYYAADDKTEDGKPTYFFRGKVSNNYVSFAGELWQIIRVNEDGSVRIIKVDGISKGTFSVTAFNNQSLISYSNSDAKVALDNWYSTSNVVNYSSYIADTGFCNDTTINQTGSGNNLIAYGSRYRVYLGTEPQFNCPSSGDLYTLQGNAKGNGGLAYPVGLISSDEVMFAGLYRYGGSSYLNNGTKWWTMSPLQFVIDGNYGEAYYGVGSSTLDGYLVSGTGASDYYYRPVVNLKPTVSQIIGDGTVDNPYIITGESMDDVQYTISYNGNGGTGVPVTVTKNHGETITIGTEIPTRTGYTFEGWATTAGASYAMYLPGGTYAANQSITLYAVWQPNSYTLTYNNNGGTGCSSKTVYYNTAIGDMCTPTRSGYTFVGWFDSNYKDTPLNYYADTYSDLKSTFGYNQSSLWNHYVTYTLNGTETRRVSQYISTDIYNSMENKTIYAGWIATSTVPNATVGSSYMVCPDDRADYTESQCAGLKQNRMNVSNISYNSSTGVVSFNWSATMNSYSVTWVGSCQQRRVCVAKKGSNTCVGSWYYDFNAGTSSSWLGVGSSISGSGSVTLDNNWAKGDYRLIIKNNSSCASSNERVLKFAFDSIYNNSSYSYSSYKLFTIN